MKQKILIICPILVLFGCVTPVYNYSPKSTEISKPELNTIKIAYVGDSILEHGEYLEHDAIYLNQTFKVFKVGVGGYTFTKGYYTKQGENQNSEFYLPAGGPDSGQVIEGAMTDSLQAIRIDKKSGKWCGISVFNIEACTDKAKYEHKKYPIARSDSFKKTLIYSGKVGSKVNIGYREFSNDFARPAFSNDVEYDLSASKVIGYKGCQIKIIDANNQFIKYKVLSYFN
ncbi:MAG: hypothetical protein ACFE0O_06195 [Opitutales bacterium]